MPLSIAATVRRACLAVSAHPRRWNRWQTAAAVAALTLLIASPCQAKPSVTITGQTPGASPFISLVSLSMDNPAWLDYVTFTVVPKPGSASRAVTARYSAAYLQRRGYLNVQTGAITVPVFGLYAGYDNTVRLTVGMVNGASEKDKLTISTASFHGDEHKHPQVVQARAPASNLSYDFMLVKTAGTAAAPIMLDTDGEIRWVDTADLDLADTALCSVFYNNGLYVPLGTSLLRVELDGAVTVLADYAADYGVTGFHHNIDVGRDGLIVDVNTDEWFECVNLEVDPATGAVLHEWNLAQIISDAMTAGGDDPTQFVKGNPDDWFHNNSTAYRASDNSLIVSSRENFVIALDYDTQAIKWILGDPSKYWHQFPSLAKYALQLAPHTQPPIGQHAVTVVRDRLLLFDDGYASLNQPIPGKSRTYSAARKFLIDTAANTATETWRYTNDKTIFSPVCSSVYEDAPHNFLLDYATGGPFKFTELIGLDVNEAKVFDFKYPAATTCNEGWNSTPVHLENMVFN